MKEKIDIFIDKNRNCLIIAEWRGGQLSGDIRQYELKKSRINMPKGREETGFIKQVEDLKKNARYDHIEGDIA